jgi:anti-sigma B factor antagonist
MAFAYVVRRADRMVSVTATGEIDATVAGSFGTALCQLSDSEPTDRIEVDLAGLIFIDSTGVAALNRAYRTTQRHGCVLVVTNATGLVLRVLSLTGALSHLSPQVSRPAEADAGRAPA